MGRFGYLAAVVMMSSIAVWGGSGLPPEVADRLDSVVALDEDDFVGSYRITISSVVQKPNGKGREESLIEAEVVNLANGATQRRLVKYIEEGADVTEKKRKKFEDGEGGRPEDRDRDDDDQDLASPFGDTANRYRFSEPKREGSTVTMRFEPAPGWEDDESVARGTVAWDSRSLDPLWLDMTAVHPPKPLKDLHMRMRFEKVANELFMSRMVTDGLAKILLLKREFHVEIQFDDIRPEGIDGD